MTRKAYSLTAILTVPVLLFFVSLIGLVGALLRDGLWDVLGPACLAAGLVVIGVARWRSARLHAGPAGPHPRPR